VAGVSRAHGGRGHGELADFGGAV